MRLRPLFTLLLIAASAGPASAATVRSVGDGDTLRVADGARLLTVRMACRSPLLNRGRCCRH